MMPWTFLAVLMILVAISPRLAINTVFNLSILGRRNALGTCRYAERVSLDQV